MQEPVLFEKMDELVSELKRRHWWRKTTPAWVNHYKDYNQARETDFISWLQFVYLPNLHQQGHFSQAMRNSSIAAQAGKCLGAQPENRRLIQLLIELDSLL